MEINNIMWATDGSDESEDSLEHPVFRLKSKLRSSRISFTLRILKGETGDKIIQFAGKEEVDLNRKMPSDTVSICS